ncbi:MAG: glucose 1-dehydrogenase [Bacteroidetes bacterium]|nr:glucose 1-dehydrogenase [Bacteroidota bacterium]
MKRMFESKVAIITGGASGIGQATAIAFARLGAKVVLADVQDAGDTLHHVRQPGGDGIYVKCDVSKEADVKALVGKTIEEYGRLDFGINNAGVEGANKSLRDLTEAEWDKTVDINLKGVWLCMKHEIPYILQQSKGAIVNTASIAAMVGFPNMAAYVASKHGIAGLTKVAALELAKTDLRVNAICPGAIRTPMAERGMGSDPQSVNAYTSLIPMGRMGLPEEIADTIVYLCSPSASYITGMVMVADGGWTVH